MQPIPAERRALTAAKQFLHLRNNLVCAGSGFLAAGALEWSFAATPSPLGREYVARLSFRETRPAEVVIVEPDLVTLAQGKKLPHVYSDEPARLCLFLPGTAEWQPWMRFDQTLIPWTTLWLYYFEDWLATGEWRGGGIHPEDQPGNRTAQRMRRRAPLGDVDFHGRIVRRGKEYR